MSDKSITLARGIEIARSFLPWLGDDKDATDFLWGHTGWPAFWRTGDPERDIKHSLRTLKRTLDSGRIACEFCGRVATLPYSRPSSCRSCYHGFGPRAAARVRREA